MQQVASHPLALEPLRSDFVHQIREAYALDDAELARLVGVSSDDIRAWQVGDSVCRGEPAEQLRRMAADKNLLIYLIFYQTPAERELGTGRLELRLDPPDDLGAEARGCRGPLPVGDDSESRWAHGEFVGVRAIQDYVDELWPHQIEPMVIALAVRELNPESNRAARPIDLIELTYENTSTHSITGTRTVETLEYDRATREWRPATVEIDELRLAEFQNATPRDNWVVYIVIGLVVALSMIALGSYSI